MHSAAVIKDNIMEDIIVYTDGGCSGNPGPGGWGYVIIDEKDGVAKGEYSDSGGEKMTTNNRMELLAVIHALDRIAEEGLLSGTRGVSVYTDSQYVKNGMTSWLASWKRNGWKTASKQPVKNQDLWLRLDGLASRFVLRWVWVKGHSGIEYNELVDRMTQTEIAKQQN